MADLRQPTEFSIHLASVTATGHINSGLASYREFEKYGNECSASDRTLDVNRIVELGVPAVTNLSLGLELLVKIHHFQIFGEYPFGHDINLLGSTFPPHDMQNLRMIYRDLYDNPETSKGLEFRYSGGMPGREPTEWPPVDFTTYDLAIAHVGPMYVRWRYIYEEIQETFDVRVAFGPLYFLAQTFHQAIRSYKGNRKVAMKDAQFIELRP